jgi:hypothetical protein
MRRLLISTVFVLALAGGSALAQTFSSLEERMTEAEFKAAGLDKLTPEELKSLNAFLAGKVVAVAPAAVPQVDNRGFENRVTGGAVLSTVNGEFRGWSGRGTRITLANGQVWEVTDSSTRLSVQLNNPAVTVTPGALGAWFLQVEGYNTRARVKRIQ